MPEPKVVRTKVVNYEPVISVACVIVAHEGRRVAGCGKGWQQIDDGMRPLICGDCGRTLAITGSYVRIDLGRRH